MLADDILLIYPISFGFHPDGNRIQRTWIFTQCYKREDDSCWNGIQSQFGISRAGDRRRSERSKEESVSDITSFTALLL